MKTTPSICPIRYRDIIEGGSQIGFPHSGRLQLSLYYMPHFNGCHVIQHCPCSSHWRANAWLAEASPLKSAIFQKWREREPGPSVDYSGGRMLKGLVSIDTNTLTLSNSDHQICLIKKKKAKLVKREVSTLKLLSPPGGTAATYLP